MLDSEQSEHESERSGPNDSDSNQLVEHFFRHQYANLVAVLTRGFGFARIDMVEDMVGAAMVQAMNSWKHRGVPDNPTGWIHRVARNKILDTLRREKLHEKALGFSSQLIGSHPDDHREYVERMLEESSPPDSLLRMMFVCCHPSLERKSQIALTLKILCGFSVEEIARGLIMKVEAVRKRIQRAKSHLANQKIEIEFPPQEELAQRLSVVHDVLYLMFNEGYCTSQGDDAIREDVCEEAARLCLLLCEQEALANPETKALLALMLFHASRLDTRTDAHGNLVLLDDQDRNKWDQKLMGVADFWLIKSVSDQPSRFHFEAVIAQLHCRASSFEDTDWKQIIALYDCLLNRFYSPVYRLNRAIAIGEAGQVSRALNELGELRSGNELKDYFLLDCASGHILEKAGEIESATDAYLAAMCSVKAKRQKALIERKLRQLAEKHKSD